MPKLDLQNFLVKCMLLSVFLIQYILSINPRTINASPPSSSRLIFKFCLFDLTNCASKCICVRVSWICPILPISTAMALGQTTRWFHQIASYLIPPLKLQTLQCALYTAATGLLEVQIRWCHLPASNLLIWLLPTVLRIKFKILNLVIYKGKSKMVLEVRKVVTLGRWLEGKKLVSELLEKPYFLIWVLVTCFMFLGFIL